MHGRGPEQLNGGMMQANTETALREALTAFETSVTSPVVSGELSDWIEKVKKSWSTVSAQITEQLHHLHPQQFQEISDADAALFRQVELLKAEDEAIECDLEKLGQTMSRMAEHLPKLEPDEAKAQPHVQSLMDQSVASWHACESKKWPCKPGSPRPSTASTAAETDLLICTDVSCLERKHPVQNSSSR